MHEVYARGLFSKFCLVPYNLNHTNYQKTINNLNHIPLFRQVNPSQHPRGNLTKRALCMVCPCASIVSINNKKSFENDLSQKMSLPRHFTSKQVFALSFFREIPPPNMYDTISKLTLRNFFRNRAIFMEIRDR